MAKLASNHVIDSERFKSNPYPMKVRDNWLEERKEKIKNKNRYTFSVLKNWTNDLEDHEELET